MSNLVTYSVPTITISGDEYYSIPVGGALPNITATAYDSFYKERYDVVIDQSTLDNTKPGLNIIYIKAKNKQGMVGTKAVYIAVTDIDESYDLSGTYARSSNGQEVHVTKLARGLYVTDNVGGVLNVPGNETFIVPAYFVQIDASSIELPAQETALGTITGANEALTIGSGTVTYKYVIKGNPYFAESTRTFNKI